MRTPALLGARVPATENIRLRLVAGAFIAGDDSSLFLVMPSSRFGPFSSRLAPMLSMLMEGASGIELAAAAVASRVAGFELSILVDSLSASGVIEEMLMEENRVIVSTLASGRMPPRAGWGIPDEPIALSRFASVAMVGNELQLQSPIASATIHFDDEVALGFLFALRNPVVAAESHTLGKSPAFYSFVALLYRHHFCDISSSDEQQRLVFWEPHDLLFHCRSRLGGRESDYGATMRFGRVAQPSRPMRAVSDATISLPETVSTGKSGPALFDLLAARRSIRIYGEQPITVREVGDFLAHCARVQESWYEELPELGIGYERSRRPYPSAGGIHPLEIYIVVASCDGLEQGLYRYDGTAHALERIPHDDSIRARLLADAEMAAPLRSRPQLLFVITACFGLMQWRYEAIACSLILKEVGCLIQTMYLVATAMGLSPCALGGGNPHLFARAIGVDELIEGSVGEFLLGSGSGDG